MSYIPVRNGYILLSAKAVSLDITCIDNLTTIQIEKPSHIQGHNCKLMSNNLELYLNSDNTMHQIFVSNVTYDSICEKEEVAQLECIFIRLPQRISLDELKQARFRVHDTENYSTEYQLINALKVGKSRPMSGCNISDI